MPNQTIKAEHGIVAPSNMVHISTLPLKLYSKKQIKSEAKTKEDRWETLPKGWTAKSRDQYAKSMAQAQEGPVSNCMDKIKGHIDNPGAFCASLHDRVTGDTHWRKGGKKKKGEADSASTMVSQLRTDKKESFKTKSSFKFKLKETNNAPFKNHTFSVILIQEGMGNFVDCFFYTKESLQKAVDAKLFEGLKCYTDHPTSIGEQIQPERSTRDILGYYQNVKFQEADDGAGQLIADLCVNNSISLDWAMSLLTNSIDYSTKFRESDLVGLSINAIGSGNPVGINEYIASNQLAKSVLDKLNKAKAQGITEINVVDELREAQSVDLVTKAGAGGKILRMLEMEKKMAKKRFYESKREKHHEDAAADASAMAPKNSPDSAAAPGDDETPDHADAAQDQALFAKMIKQYLGQSNPDNETMEAAKHAYEAHKEAGMEHEEAYEAAGKHLKMAMEIGKKMAQCKQSEADTHEAMDEAEEGEEHESMEADDDDMAPPKGKKGAALPPGVMGKESKKKESIRSAMRIEGELSQLRESVKHMQLKEYLDGKLKNSGEYNSITKPFKERLLKKTNQKLPSKQFIDESWNEYISGVKSERAREASGFSGALLTEKTSFRESDSALGMSGMADCVRS